MIKEYKFGNETAIFYDGDDLVNIFAEANHAPNAIKHTNFSKEDILSLYRYALLVDTGMNHEYVFMTGPEFPSNLNNIRGHICFTPNRYVLGAFRSFNHPLNIESNVMNLLLKYEREHGDKDSYYRKSLEKLDNIDEFYIVTVKMQQPIIEKIRLYRDVSLDAVFFYYNSDCINIGVRTRGDDGGMGNAALSIDIDDTMLKIWSCSYPLRIGQCWISTNGPTPNTTVKVWPVYLNEKGAEVGLEKEYQNLCENLEDDISYHRREIQRLNKKLCEIRRIISD